MSLLLVAQSHSRARGRCYFHCPPQIQVLDQPNLAEVPSVFLPHKNKSLEESREGESCWLAPKCSFAVLSACAAGTEGCSLVPQVRHSLSDLIFTWRKLVFYMESREFIPGFGSGLKDYREIFLLSQCVALSNRCVL